jgi:predicted nuclease of restriction endonuclease-like (RecB) superfamily
MKKSVQPEKEYVQLVYEAKERIVSARISAARRINKELINLYWDLGDMILHIQESSGWGESVVQRLSKDLQKEFPDMTGLSPQNLWLMRQMVFEYKGRPILQQLVGEIPWGQNILILQKIKSDEERKYYLEATSKFGWTRNVLLNQIKAGAYERARLEKKAHNFPAVLPSYLAEQADEAMKSSYNLEFLGISREIGERELEGRLIEKLRDFILELGYGFCFVGQQFRLAAGEKEYFIDLLFYHRILKSLIAIELKIGAFEPEYAGKMDFYLNLLNEKEKSPDDNPSIGIILCAEKDDMVVEFSLKSKANPIGVAEYQLTRKLPKELKGKLPSEKELRAALLSGKKRGITDAEAGRI